MTPLQIALYIATGAIVGLIFFKNGYREYLEEICVQNDLPDVDQDGRTFVAMIMFGILWPLALMAPIRRKIQGKPFWDHHQ